MAESAVKVKPSVQYAPRLKSEYFNKFQAELQKELGLRNINESPKLEKIIISVGLGKAKDEKRLLDVAKNTLQKITGQSPVDTAAKKSIASFKLREGSKVGLKVTLRDDRMYEFADRLISIVMPRLRDFRGVSPKSFDAAGNFSLGLTDQSVFPELSFEDTATPHGLQVTFVIKSEDPAHSKALLEKFGLPFERPQPEVKNDEITGESRNG